MRPAGCMQSFASTPAVRTKDTVIWSFNGQNCSFYNLNWITVRHSQKNGVLFFIQNVFYTWKYDRLFPSVRNILNKENILYVRHVKRATRRPHVVCCPHDNTHVTNMALGGPSVWHAWGRLLYVWHIWTWRCADRRKCVSAFIAVRISVCFPRQPLHIHI
jgi:hypothetical protein